MSGLEFKSWQEPVNDAIVEPNGKRTYACSKWFGVKQTIRARKIRPAPPFGHASPLIGLGPSVSGSYPEDQHKRTKAESETKNGWLWSEPHTRGR